MRRWFCFPLLLALLSGCLPASAPDPGLEVAIVNAPAGERAPFLAERLQEEILGLPGCCSFGLIRPAPLRFQETHRDMFGSRAAPAAASIARSLGAEVAVMAAAPRFERSVERVRGGRHVTGVVRVNATVIDASTGMPLGSAGSLTFRGARFVPGDRPLPEPDEDPLMIALTEEAARDLAPQLTALLSGLSRESGSVR
ncbi:MAG TPA: hypothetical protein VF168_10735 [Trueperaceae bacterium]